jgi:UDP-N-acetylmuramate dehydrogenase
LPERLIAEMTGVERNVPLAPFTTLRVGGPADFYARASTSEELAKTVALAQREGVSYEVLGLGSNVVVSDAGVRGLLVHIACAGVRAGETTVVECGAAIQDVFLATAQAGLTGLEWAVGIPGTVGGALVSNAGAYRGSIGELVESLDVVEDGELRSVGPEWMEFRYRDSSLRRGTRRGVLVRVALRLRWGDPRDIYARAWEFQSQRRIKQPRGPSAGSFFKNVYDDALAARLPALPPMLLSAGVVPAGYLISAAGLGGVRVGRAEISKGHANFLINRGGATAAEIAELAALAEREVLARFGVGLEKEVLYFGDWGSPQSA